MSLKVYCNRYAHFKDVRVCSFNCAYRARCRDFALFYDDNRADTDAVVAAYIAARGTESASAHAGNSLVRLTNITSLLRLEVKREMAEATYIWVDKDDRAEMLDTEEVIRRAERGAKAKHIYKVAQEMELRYQLVPRRGIEKAKRLAAAEADVARARRSRLRQAATSETEASTSTGNVAPSAMATADRERSDASSSSPAKKTPAASRRARRTRATAQQSVNTKYTPT